MQYTAAECALAGLASRLTQHRQYQAPLFATVHAFIDTEILGARCTMHCNASHQQPPPIGLQAAASFSHHDADIPLPT